MATTKQHYYIISHNDGFERINDVGIELTREQAEAHLSMLLSEDGEVDVQGDYTVILGHVVIPKVVVSLPTVRL